MEVYIGEISYQSNFIKRVLNKKEPLYLNKKEIEGNISISGDISHTSSHAFFIEKEISKKYPTIMFMDKHRLEKYIHNISEEKRKELFVISLYKNYKIDIEEIINKKKKLIFLLEKENIEDDILMVLDYLYQSIKNQHLKVMFLYKEDFLHRNFAFELQNQQNYYNNKNISFIYLCYEIKFSIISGINIIHKHYDPEYNVNAIYKSINNQKKIINIRDIRDLSKESFFIIKNNKIELCNYPFEIRNHEKINLKKYIKNEMSLKMESF